jgi:hypothetical protein
MISEAIVNPAPEMALRRMFTIEKSKHEPLMTCRLDKVWEIRISSLVKTLITSLGKVSVKRTITSVHKLLCRHILFSNSKTLSDSLRPMRLLTSVLVAFEKPSKGIINTM